MIIHQPVKNRTPAAMEAIVFRFSPQSMHSEHLKPSRNPDIFFFFQVSPAPPVQSVRNPVSPRAGLPTSPVPAKKAKQPQAAGYPDRTAPPPGQECACGSGRRKRPGKEGRWAQEEPESHAHHAGVSAHARNAPALGPIRCALSTAGCRKW